MKNFINSQLQLIKNIFGNVRTTVVAIAIFLLLSSNIYLLIAINIINHDIRYLESQVEHIESTYSNLRHEQNRKDERIEEYENQINDLENQNEDNESRIDDLENQVND